MFEGNRAVERDRDHMQVEDRGEPGNGGGGKPAVSRPSFYDERHLIIEINKREDGDKERTSDLKDCKVTY